MFLSPRAAASSHFAWILHKAVRAAIILAIMHTHREHHTPRQQQIVAFTLLLVLCVCYANPVCSSFIFITAARRHSPHLAVVCILIFLEGLFLIINKTHTLSACVHSMRANTLGMCERRQRASKKRRLCFELSPRLTAALGEKSSRRRIVSSRLWKCRETQMSLGSVAHPCA